MELLEISVASHKVLKNLVFDLRNSDGSTKSIVVFAGINGSGKTSILEYVNRKLRDKKFDQKGYVSILTEFDKLNGEERLLKEVKSIRVDSNLLKSIDIEGESDFLNGNQRGVYFDADGNFSPVIAGKIELFEKVIRSISDKVIFLKTESFQYKNFNDLLYHYVDSYIYEKNVKPREAFEEVRKIISDVFDGFDLSFEFDSIEAVRSESEGQKFNVYFKNEYSNRIQLSSLSTGEKELVTKAFYLEVLKPKEAVVMIDEPERSLHPKWQQKMIDLYKIMSKKYGCQFIIATHSPQIISSVEPENVYLLGRFDGDKASIDVRNLYEMNQKSLGLEPNRVLREVMGLETLRYSPVVEKIERLANLMKEREYDENEVDSLLTELVGVLGENDPAIIRATHRIAVMKRKKQLAR